MNYISKLLLVFTDESNVIKAVRPVSGNRDQSGIQKSPERDEKHPASSVHYRERMKNQKESSKVEISMIAAK